MTDDVRRKIKALRSKARASGATEAEAMAAAERAAQIMREHGLSDADVEFGQMSVAVRTRGGSPRDRLWGTVSRCTNTAAVLREEWGAPEITFVGRDPGPEIACYLVEVLNRAIDREIERFKAGPSYRRRRSITTKRAAVHDFTTGLVSRLRARLLDMFSDSQDDDAAEQARDVRAQRFPGTGTVSAPERKVRFGDAAGAGWSAGGRVPLSHGVTGGSAAPRQIGGN